MALINRISKLFTADLHAVLDRIEEPEVLLNQAVRDMAEELDSSEHRLARLNEAARENEARLAEIGSALETTQGEIDVCLASNEDELAKTVVRRKLELQASQRALDNEARVLAEAIERMQTTVDDQRRELDAVKRQADAAVEGVSVTSTSTITQEDVEVALLKEKARGASS